MHDLGDDLQYLVTPADSDVLPIDLEFLRPHPRRKSGRIIVRDTYSFAAYVLKHKTPGTLILAEDRSVLAILDHHEEDLAGWADHTVELEFKFTPAWTAWNGFAGTYIEQQSFAEFIEDNLSGIASPDGADLLELAKNLRATLSANYRKATPLFDGTVQFEYVETIDASSPDGRLTVPQTLLLALRVFVGGEVREVPARLRYRLREGRVEFLIRLGDEARTVFEESFEEELRQIAALTELAVYRGHRVH